jgi:putative endonuclease
MSSEWFLYLIRCADRSLYTGITTDVDRRFAEHCAQGRLCAKYLRGRGPLTLVLQVRVGTRVEAARLEVRVKRLSKAGKEAIVIGEMSLEALGSDRVTG